MSLDRIIPVLTIHQERLIKTIKFKYADAIYLGDPLNVLRIYNAKCVDEIIVLDISTSRTSSPPNIDLIRALASAAFMPLTYGGGVSNMEEARQIFALGVEKVSVNMSPARRREELLANLISEFGAQSIVASVDIVTTHSGPKVFDYLTGKHSDILALEYIRALDQIGPGEYLINFPEHDGVKCGYAIPEIKQISLATRKSLVACGGCSSIENMARLKAEVDINGFAAGALFSLFGRLNAPLPTYPSDLDLKTYFSR